MRDCSFYLSTVRFCVKKVGIEQRAPQLPNLLRLYSQEAEDR